MKNVNVLEKKIAREGKEKEVIELRDKVLTEDGWGTVMMIDGAPPRGYYITLDGGKLMGGEQTLTIVNPVTRTAETMPLTCYLADEIMDFRKYVPKRGRPPVLRA